MARKVTNWREQPVDHKIWPLVDGLNQTSKVQTIASCEGHFWRTSDPYVYFRCSPTAAEALAKTLDKIRWSGAVHHYWSLQGVFDTDHRLAFTLRSEVLSHERGVLTTFWRYVVRRRQIDDDLAVLARRLPEALEHVDDLRELPGVLKPSEQGNKDKEREQRSPPIAPSFFPERVQRPAVRALAGMIRRKLFSTHLARAKLRHVTTPFDRSRSKSVAGRGWRRKC